MIILLMKFKDFNQYMNLNYNMGIKDYVNIIISYFLLIINLNMF